MANEKPIATIDQDWDGDTYYYTLLVDGQVVINAYTSEECTREAERLGAELKRS